MRTHRWIPTGLLVVSMTTLVVSRPAAGAQEQPREKERAFRGSDPGYRSRIGTPSRFLEASSSPELLALEAVPARLVLQDPLTNGRTVGVRDNGPGEFVPGGWKVTSSMDNIRYTTPLPIEEGAIEFDVTGLVFDDTRVPNHRGQLLSMYDASFGDPRHRYSPDLRLNPFKFVLHRYGRDEEAYFANHLKLIMNTDGVNQFEDYSAIGPYRWDPSVTYHMRLEWRDGIIRLHINGQDTDPWPFVYRSIYRAEVHDIRIGTNTRWNAIIDAVYSNVKIYDYGVAPGSPIVNQPPAGSQVQSLTPHIDWSGERHTHYQVRVTTSADPDGDIAWDSGEVASPLHYATSDTLSNDADYFVHVRLANARGWGPWSAPSRFTTNLADPPRVPRYGEYEIALRTRASRASPYTDVALTATFTGPTETLRVSGFWDGGSLYKIRFLPTETGTWHWTTSSNHSELNGLGGSFESVASARKGYFRVSRSRPYGFEWAGDGSPFFLMGDTLWHMYYNLRFTDGSFQTVIDARSSQHFNYAHGVVHDALSNEGGPVFSRQLPDLEIYDVDSLSPGYFQWLDERVDYLNARGMAAGLFFSWGDGHYQEYQTASQYERFLRYMVARYGSKNVAWIVVGEFEEAGEPLSRWRDYMRIVQEADPYDHPISMHTTSTTNAFGADPQHSFVSQQLFGSPEELRQRITDSRRFGKPVVNLEYGYEGDPRHHGNNQPAEEVRRDHYALVLAGGFGVYGNNTPNNSTYHRVADFRLTSTDTPGALYLQILYEFFTSFGFERLAPAQNLVSQGIAAASSSDIVVQLPSGGTVSVDLRNAGGSREADWFDPRTGARTSAGAAPGGAGRSFTAPDGRDWILHVRSYPLGGSGSVSVDLGSPDIEAGMSNVRGGDGDTVPVEMGGRTARRNQDPASDHYFYFEVADGFAFEGNRPLKQITIEYWDGGSGSLRLEYDASGAVYKNGGSIARTGTNTWKSHTFQVSDAFFGNRQNGRADFRVVGEGVFHLDNVRVAHGAPGPPGLPTSPEPGDRATGVALNATLAWNSGGGAISHVVHFGETNPPPVVANQSGTSFDPGRLEPRTTYFWRVNEVNDSGTTQGPLWRFTTADAGSKPTLSMKPAGALAIDGNPADWALAEFTEPVRAGELRTGDFARVGYDGGTLYTAGYATHFSLPASEADHSASVYGRHSATHLYFLVRVSDDDVRTPFGPEMNWANDCVEIYLDPGADGGRAPLNGSSSDVQLVIDAFNRRNVYMTTSAYRTAVLDGVTSAVARDRSGYWLEVAIEKRALSPSITGRVGVDFNFRDNDQDNRPEASTVYTWSDFERSASFPSKIPDRWGLLVLAGGDTRATLEVAAGAPSAIDGNPADWNLSANTRRVRGGETGTGDVALVGFDAGSVHAAGFATHLSLPASASDHTATVYGRHDAENLYFLVRVLDESVETPFGVDANWANDAVEIYLDPGLDGGSSPLSSSASDVQIVIDAANRKNVFMTTASYRERVLNGIASAISRDTQGYWLEVRIGKSSLQPALGPTFGVDFNFRDNDQNNLAQATTVYTWSDPERSASFPSKIPGRWGRATLVP